MNGSEIMSFRSRPEEVLLKKIKAAARANNRSLAAEIESRSAPAFEESKCVDPVKDQVNYLKS